MAALGTITEPQKQLTRANIQANIQRQMDGYGRMGYIYTVQY